MAVSYDPHDTLVPIETKELGVVVPRAQLKAYKAAAKALRDIEERSFGWEARQIARDALAALRAAGIHEGEGNGHKE